MNVSPARATGIKRRNPVLSAGGHQEVRTRRLHCRTAWRFGHNGSLAPEPTQPESWQEAKGPAGPATQLPRHPPMIPQVASPSLAGRHEVALTRAFGLGLLVCPPSHPRGSVSSGIEVRQHTTRRGDSEVGKRVQCNLTGGEALCSSNHGRRHRRESRKGKGVGQPESRPIPMQ